MGDQFQQLIRKLNRRGIFDGYTSDPRLLVLCGALKPVVAVGNSSGRGAVLQIGGVEMDLRLMFRPLVGLTDKEDNFGFDGFNIVDRVVWHWILVLPDVNYYVVAVAPPGIAVVAVLSFGHEALFEPAIQGLEGNANVDWPLEVVEDDIEFGSPACGNTGKPLLAVFLPNRETPFLEGKVVPLWSREAHGNLFRVGLRLMAGLRPHGTRALQFASEWWHQQHPAMLVTK